ncbi:MAG: peptidylprolyl isomerase [Candidatus Aenigmarchaeota archaeon]|nr:peptidylprolyl isomerase [Candidatus Aenigmarchaeota archaeon]
MQKNDFIKIKFSGKIKELGQEFDKADDITVIIGAGYVIKGLDEALEGMEVGGEKTVEILPEKGFGGRDPSLIKLIPLAEFKKRDTNPVPGMFVEADNRRGRVLSVSSGRVRVDFNHPLAGKVLVYDVKINGKVDDLNEKIFGMISFYTKLPKENIKVEAKGKEIEIIIPPVIHPVYKKKIADDIIKYLGMDKVKFAEVFEKKNRQPETVDKSEDKK